MIADFRLTVENGRKVSDVLGDGTDEALRSLFQRGVFDEVPVIGWFVKACNVASDIQAYRFCKKIYRFVFLTQEYDREKLDKFWQEYSAANQEDGYELMLSVLDKVNNLNKVDIMANLLRAKLEGQLSIENYIRLVASLQQIPYVDIKYLPDYLESIGTRHDTYMLLAAGLLYNSAIGIDQVGAENSNRYQLNDNGLLFVKYGLKLDISGYIKDQSQKVIVADSHIPEQLKGEYPEINEMLK